MRIFKFTSDTRNQVGTFIGFHVDAPVDINLTLLSVGRQVSKSFLLRSIMDDWLKGKDVIGVVAEQAYSVWQAQGEHWRPPLQEYKKGIQTELAAKGIPEDMINQIIKRFESKINAKKKTSRKNK